MVTRGSHFVTHSQRYMNIYSISFIGLSIDIPDICSNRQLITNMGGRLIV